MSNTPKSDVWMANLRKVGGLENSLVSIPAGGVVKIINEFAETERELAKYKRDGWIDVKDNTPQEHDPVLLFHPKEKKAYMFQVSCIPKLHIFKGATHYMNIPDPPEIAALKDDI